MLSALSLPRTFRLAPLLVALLLTACAKPEPYAAPQKTGTLPAPVTESSGLTASRRASNLLWTLNDSGGEAVLYAIEPGGGLRGSLRVNGLAARDWEDIASFELDGRTWLLIADVGDNASNRKDCALYIVPEPAPEELSPARAATVEVAWKLPVRYIDGPRDCEAVAVDARAGTVYLLAKRTSPHGLYTLALRPPADGVTGAAIPIAQIPNSHFPQPTATQRMLPIPTGRYRAQPTSMDFADDGSAAVVLSYGDVLFFPRGPNESWQTALRRPPVVLEIHGLAQAEGVAFGADHRTIYVTSEGAESSIMRYSPR